MGKAIAAARQIAPDKPVEIEVETGAELELAAAKANEAGTIAKLGLERVREASKLGLARWEAALPGLGVRLEMFGTEASKLGVLAVAKGKEVAINAREGLALLLR